MQGVIAFIVVLGTLILVHEFGHFMVARKKGVKVESFSIGFGPQIFSLKRHQVEYRISLIPLGGYVKMAGDEHQSFKGKTFEFLSKPVGVRAAIVFAGPLLNYLLALIIFCLIFYIGNPTLTSKIGKVLEDYPAEKAGIRKGDVIKSINGQKVSYWDDVPKLIQKTSNKPISLNILRDKESLTFVIEPVLKEKVDIFGEAKKVPLIGIAPSGEIVYARYPFLQSIYKGTESLISRTVIMLKFIWNLIVGRIDIRKTLTGPVGIFFITKEAVAFGIRPLLQLVAILSLNLAILNLFPVPVLDGGHLFFLAIEKMRGKPVSRKVMEISTGIGLAILLILIIFIFYNDFINFQIIEKLQNLWKAK
jgi:regulator of sigma E protease